LQGLQLALAQALGLGQAYAFFGVGGVAHIEHREAK